MGILVIGGSRFFGKGLVRNLINSGEEVTLLNRGNLDDGFGRKVNRIKMDRANFSRENPALNREWDIVYDQVCYDAEEARKACETFRGRVKKYIFTSTASVYPMRGNLIEGDFDPTSYKYDREVLRSENYGEGKRQAESVFFRELNCSVIAVRFPIVLGPDDYTHRLKFHIDRIRTGRGIYFANLDAKLAFVSSQDAADFLTFLGGVNFHGPVNCSSEDILVLRKLIEDIERQTGQKAVFTKKGEGDNSPFGSETDWFMLCERARSLGFQCQPHSQWLPNLIEYFDRQFLLSELC